MHLKDIIEQYEGMWYIMHNSCYTRYNRIGHQKGEVKLRCQKSRPKINNFSNLIINYPEFNTDTAKHIASFFSNLSPNLMTVLKQISKFKLTILGSCEWSYRNIIYIKMYYKDIALQETIFLTSNNLIFSVLVIKSKKEIKNVTFSSWIRLKSKTTLNLCD